MPDHQHWVRHDADYQTQVLYTDDAADADADQATEWLIFELSSGDQVANGWGRTPSGAREAAEKKLTELRTADASAVGSNPPIDEDAT